MIQVINGREVSIIRYRAGIVELSKNELEAIDKDKERQGKEITNHEQKFAPKGSYRQFVMEEGKLWKGVK